MATGSWTATGAKGAAGDAGVIPTGHAAGYGPLETPGDPRSPGKAQASRAELHLITRWQSPLPARTRGSDRTRRGGATGRPAPRRRRGDRWRWPILPARALAVDQMLVRLARLRCRPLLLWRPDPSTARTAWPQLDFRFVSESTVPSRR